VETRCRLRVSLSTEAVPKLLSKPRILQELTVMTAERMKPVLRAKATSNKNRKDRADGEKHNIFSITRFRHCTVEVEEEDLWIIGAVV
jgi:hypothetical protein